MEAEPEPETPNLADLKRIVRERISASETNQRLTGKSFHPEKT
jgi:hypothetical protein